MSEISKHINLRFPKATYDFICSESKRKKLTKKEYIFSQLDPKSDLYLSIIKEEKNTEKVKEKFLEGGTKLVLGYMDQDIIKVLNNQITLDQFKEIYLDILKDEKLKSLIETLVKRHGLDMK